jgi:hypothetical protein
MDKKLISEEDTFLWQLRGDLKRRTDSEIMAANDQALQVKYHVTKKLQKQTVSHFRLCPQFDETVEHIISTYPILSREQYNTDMIQCVLNYTLTYARKYK